MSGNCSICLGTLSEPVCIPCGHVYCTNCLAAHVNSSNDADQITATCPTCRFEFYTVTPDLTYLPKKYHQYVLPAVRRVYVDNNTVQSLQKKLAKAEGRVRKLENDQELLLKKCEGHMAASQAHASSEYDALREIERLKGKLEGLGRQMEATETLQYELEMSVSQVHYEVSYWKAKYNKMKHRLQCVETM
ncbi:hypothetical protein AX15_001018 [Amanita polypyramis BW_CC]|nr:hypothetical protein AX15_001018 [Amanita polypyramis BW_CC]